MDDIKKRLFQPDKWGDRTDCPSICRYIFLLSQYILCLNLKEKEKDEPIIFALQVTWTIESCEVCSSSLPETLYSTIVDIPG